MMARGGSPSAWFGGPLWASGFRPFFLLGAVYGLVALGAVLPSLLGATMPSPLGERDAAALASLARVWHGHEMIFGFAAAIICGLLLTALPSWAGVPEQVRGRLAFLAMTWLAGRLAICLVPLLPPALVAVADVATLVALTVMLAPGLLAAADKRFLAVLPVLLALAATNLAFHWQLAAGTPVGVSRALDAAVAVVAILFSLTGGFMTPVFTRNAMAEIGAADRVREHRLVEWAAHASVVGFALVVTLAASARTIAGFAIVACVVHSLRLAGWRGYAVRGNAMVFAMHVAYAWFVITFALVAASAMEFGVAPRAWIHAFTIGAVGTMMLALMPRVSLRHTGRPLALVSLMTATYPAMTVAALLRLGAATAGWGTWAIGAAALLWVLCFAAYLTIYGPMLVRASLPRSPPE
jgi:uncharacterized protein involved in response to NO